MSEMSAYTVISTGQLQEDFGLEDVKNSFAKLFKTTPEKASAYVGVKKVLKKNLDHKKAHTLKTRLEQIGMVIALKEHKSAAADAMPLSIEEKTPVEEDNMMVCPKCNLRQEKAEQCAGCGVYIQKLIAPSASDTVIGQSTIMKAPNMDQAANATGITAAPSIETSNGGKGLNVVGIAAAAGVAIIGALLWKYITVWFGYEFAIIAIGIGAGVGIAAVMFESEGMATGALCAIFTLLSIFGGKYMAMSYLQETWTQDITAAIEGEEDIYKAYYQQDLKAAEAFGDGIEDKKELIAFLKEHGYEEYYDVNNISDAEIADFNEYVVPHLKRISDTNPSFEEWLQGSFQENVENISTSSLVFLDFGLMGILFLILGVGTAFKMGMGEG